MSAAVFSTEFFKNTLQCAFSSNNLQKKPKKKLHISSSWTSWRNVKVMTKSHHSNIDINFIMRNCRRALQKLKMRTKSPLRNDLIFFTRADTHSLMSTWQLLVHVLSVSVCQLIIQCMIRLRASYPVSER